MGNMVASGCFFKKDLLFLRWSKMEVDIITQSSHLPRLESCSFFHSEELFKMIEDTPGMYPLMAVVTDEAKHVKAHLLASVQRRRSLFPPYLFTRARIYGEGVYKEEGKKETFFQIMFSSLVQHISKHGCLYIEVSDLSKKMFAYKIFRQNRFFPISWLRIHNSLHSESPERRISSRALKKIKASYNAGVITREVNNDDEIIIFHKLLKSFYRFKLQRNVPSVKFFLQIGSSINGHIYVTLFKDRIIGGSVVVDSGGDAIIWFDMAKKKTYPTLYPHLLTVWHAIDDAYQRGCNHIHFLNVGLPFRASRHRDLILRFGGKPTSSFRWFRLEITWLNRLWRWLTRE